MEHSHKNHDYQDLSQWQSLLKLGNESFHEQQFQQAEFFYSEAYDLLAHQYRSSPKCADTLMAWICTCHNLSSLYEEMGRLEVSLRFLMVPHEYLIEVTESEVQDEDIKLIAFKGLSLTLAPIMQFAQKHPICEGCKDKLESMEQLLSQDASQIH
ncbi:hypothetical protein [Thalassotalea euphylliae]|uniref:DUF2753 family protein n=1 Tax=Thalassotalea euphylliae TaxID=1655234 RepID=A0A3E0TZP5_9GAMM|nr:hypothetical protein [Thalassotalea euphylliae]REL29857.1 hypothetical protein DXX94_03580 [Thalassotalea euphylliae]